MSLTIDALADAVKTLITPMVTAASGTVERAYVPDRRPEDLADLIVTVVPSGEAWTRLTRGGVWRRDPTIDVAPQQVARTQAERDTLMQFTRALAIYLSKNGPAAGASPLKLTVGPIYSPEHMRTKQVFTSIITVTYIGGGV